MRSILPSGYLAVIDEGCVGCGKCAENCQFDAIDMISFTNNGKEQKRAQIIKEKCFGCGICESKCKNENISMVLDPEKGIPLNIEELAKAQITEANAI